MWKRFLSPLVLGAAALLTLTRCQQVLTHTPQNAPSSGWVSSGGEVFEDKNNPWFLHNVAEVRYCVAVDRATISIAPERLASIVEDAIGYWRKEFALFQTSTGRATTLLPAIASQNFIAGPCDGKEDIRFQFGAGTLSIAQQAYLAHQNQYLSLAVRTGYDRKTLRGRGFVYVASDIGEQRQPKGAIFIDRPWEKEGLLLRVLVHELGHVFGLPHVGEGLMSAPYPEAILRRDMWEKFQKREMPETFFTAQQSYKNCAMTKDGNAAAMAWLGMPTTDKCLYLRSDNHSGIAFTSSANDGGAEEVIGNAVITGDPAGTYVEIGRAGMLYLPAEQELFTDPDLKSQKFLATSAFLSVGFTMEYTAAKGAAKPLQVRLQPNGYELVGLDDGKIRSLLVFRRGCQSVLSLLMCFEI